MFTSRCGKYFDEDEGIRQITSVEQLRGEPLCDYLDYFEGLLRKYPNHGLEEYIVIDSFLSGMDPVHYQKLTYAAGGSLNNLFEEEVWDLIYDMAGRPRASDHQQDQEVMAELKELVKELAEKVERQDESLKELSKLTTELATAVLEMQEAERERELKTQNCESHAESYADPEQLICAVPKELLEKSSSTAQDKSSSTAHDSVYKNQCSNSDILLPSTLQVSKATDKEVLGLFGEVGTRVSNHGHIVKNVSIRFMPYRKRSPASAHKPIPIKLSMESPSCEDFGWKPGWRRTEVVLPDMSCGRQRRLPIRRFDYTHPWDPNL